MKEDIALLILIITSTFSIAQNQNVSNGNVFDGEPYLAIDPNNSQHLVVAWMGWIDFSNRFKIKTKTSFDGGETWSEASELPHTIDGYSSADPSIDFNRAGEVFICYIDFTGTEPPVTGGIYICKSEDGGLSWDMPFEVINTDFDGTKWPIDRPWMEIDKSTGINAGTIYVTSMNLNRTNAPYNPYLSVSRDTGNSFTSTYLDTEGWLSGSLIITPMCSPAISSSGVFYGVYPSYVITQSLFAQAFMVSSADGGESFNHSLVRTINPPSNTADYPSAKIAQHLFSNPSNPNHPASISVSAELGDLDVFFMETFDAGSSWTEPIRLNDDPIGNNRMQDLIWGDFDDDGDIVISWRDRRNGTDSTYQTASEIWATYRDNSTMQFSPNFQITSEIVDYDDVLDNAGNDFMCIKLQDDTLNAVWGDTRDGNLNIWFQRMNADGSILSVKQIATEEVPHIFIYPNPTSAWVTIEYNDLKQINVFDLEGKKIVTKVNIDEAEKVSVNLENYPSGVYLIEVSTSDGVKTQKVIKE